MAVVGAPQPGAAYAHLDEAGRDAHMGKVFTRAVTLAPDGAQLPRFRGSVLAALDELRRHVDVADIGTDHAVGGVGIDFAGPARLSAVLRTVPRGGGVVLDDIKAAGAVPTPTHVAGVLLACSRSNAEPFGKLKVERQDPGADSQAWVVAGLSPKSKPKDPNFDRDSVHTQLCVVANAIAQRVHPAALSPPTPAADLRPAGDGPAAELRPPGADLRPRRRSRSRRRSPPHRDDADRRRARSRDRRDDRAQRRGARPDEREGRRDRPDRRDAAGPLPRRDPPREASAGKDPGRVHARAAPAAPEAPEAPAPLIPEVDSTLGEALTNGNLDNLRTEQVEWWGAAKDVSYPAEGIERLCSHWAQNPEEFVGCLYDSETQTVQCAFCPHVKGQTYRPRLLAPGCYDVDHYWSRRHLDSVCSRLSWQDSGEHRTMLAAVASEDFRRGLSNRTPVMDYFRELGVEPWSRRKLERQQWLNNDAQRSTFARIKAELADPSD